MIRFLAVLLGFWSTAVIAIPCDCEVRVHPPLTGSHQIGMNVIQTYELEEFSSYAVKNQKACRQSCLEEFQKDMPAQRLNALLLTYSEQLVSSKAVGYNCTGLTTLKYPVRVRAKLGNRGLGNVADIIQVVSHEELCF